VSDNELLIAPYDESPIEIVPQAIGRLACAEGYNGLVVPSAARLCSEPSGFSQFIYSRQVASY
jgi:hypothetical protein